MPSFISVWMREQIRLAKPLLKRMSIEDQRAGQDRIGALGARALAAKVDFEPEPFDRFAADWATPKDRVPERAILYLHGGSYTAGSLKYARGFGGLLAHRTGRRVLCAAYRLAPETPFPGAVEDAVEAYRRMLETYPGHEIAIVGESAGGGLAYGAAQAIRDGGLPLPGCLVAISPWADLTLSGASYREQERRDPSLVLEDLAESARLYAGERRADPLVSPVFGDFTGFPPSLLFAGTDELLRDDARALAGRLRQCGAACDLVVAEGMWHVYVLFGIPEAQEALKRIAAFLERNGGREDG